MLRAECPRRSRRPLVAPFFLAYAGLAACGALSACAGPAATGATPAATPATATDNPVELSGEWNDVDAELVATEIIRDFLASDWIADWRARNGDRTPTLRLYPIRNRTTGYIDHRFFTKRFEAALVRSGKMTVLLANDEKPRTSDGEDLLTQDDAAARGRDEREVDFIFSGTLVVQEDRAGDRQVSAYLATVEIIETATQRKAWIGQKRIRKLIDAKEK